MPPEEVHISEGLSLNPSFQSSVALLIHAIALVTIGEIPPLYSGLHHIIAFEEQIKFLEFQFSKGNDLITPKKEINFPGLKPQDRWCVCAGRWVEAYNQYCATPIVLASTHIDVLKIIDFKILKKFAIDLN